MSRQKIIPPENMTPEQREQYDRIGRFRTPREDTTYGGPYDPWILHPELAKRAVSWGTMVWERTSIGRRLVEMAIVVTARFWESNVEWVSHTRLALDNGVSQDTIDAVFAKKRPVHAPEDELLIYDICITLHETHQLSMELYDRGIKAFGEKGLMDIVATIGYYTFVAMTLSVFDVKPFGGVTGPFPIS